jgi:microcystin degradation protein MlrC
VHESRPWRIREIAPDFTLADAWALPVYGGAGDFPHLLEVMASRDLSAPHWVAIAGFAHG